MSPRRSPAAKNRPACENGRYEFDDADPMPKVELLAERLKSLGKGKEALFKLLKQLAAALEAAPQDVEALGSSRESLPLQLLQRATAESADKNIRLYCALCIMHVMRVYAPDLPYDDEGLKDVFELLVTCWARLADTEAFELCYATLKTFADVKFYIPMMDLEDPDLVVRTFGTLLQAARPENLQALEGPLMAVLTGILEELDQVPQELCDLVLAALVCPPAGAAAQAGAGGGFRAKGAAAAGAAAATQYTVAGQRLAVQLLTSRDSAVRGAVQRHVLSYVRKSLQEDAATAGAGGGTAAAAGGSGRGGKKAAATAGGGASRIVAEGALCDTLTILNGLHASAPLLLLPVVPELKAQLRHEEDKCRVAAAELVTRLMASPTAPAAGPSTAALQQTSSMATGTLGLVTAAPGTGAGGPLAAQYPDLFQELLARFADQSPALRLQMLLRTGQMVAVATAAKPDGALERQVLAAARDRLHDFDDRVRAAACRGLCSLAAAAAIGQPPPGSVAAAAAAPPVLYDNDMDAVLQDVGTRLRDRKIVVRKDAAAGLLVAWRAACEALQQGALSLPGLLRTVGWIPARLCTEATRDLELRPHVMALLAAPPTPQQLLHHTHGGAGGVAGRPGPGLVPASLGKQLGSTVWAALWGSYGDSERTAVRKLLSLKAQAGVELQQLVELRKRLRAAAATEGSPPASPEAAAQRNVQRLQRRLAAVCRSLARDAGGPAGAPTRGSEQLWSLLASAKDNFFWDRLGELAAPGTSHEALAAARKDALSRLPNGGSKAPAADLITRISHTGQPTLLTPNHVAGLIAALDAAGGGGSAADNAVAAAAGLAVAVAKSAPGLCCAAVPLLVPIVTADPPRQELTCTTAVRVLRHAARHCTVGATGGTAAATPARGGSDGGGSPAVQTNEAAGAKRKRKEEAGNGDEDELEEVEEKDEAATPKRGKKRARTAGTTGVASPNGAARPVTRGQQQQLAGAAEAMAEAAAAEVGGAGGESRAFLARALTSLSQGPYAKAAKAAVHALWAILGPQEGTPAVSQLAAQLVGQLRQGREAMAATPAVLQAMASVGEVAPGVFAEHAEEFCKFITQLYMFASLKPSAAAGVRKARGRNSAAAVDALLGDGAAAGTGDVWDQPSYGIVHKVGALRALVRGCTPDADALAATAAAVPAATTDAVSSYVTDLLIQLLSIEDDMAEYGAAGEGDKAHLRMAAARALLRLAKRHDSRLSASSYVSLALTMQDPILEVRQAFGEQVRLFLHSALQHRRRPHVIAKYAALLPLAAMDPRAEHRDAAARTLREVVLMLRLRAQEAALEAATVGHNATGTVTDVSLGGGGGVAATTSRPSLSDLPEFMLEFLVYILAHHPDCPVMPASGSQEVGGGSELPPGAGREEEEAVPEPDDYRPFQDMLQFALEPLLAAPAQQVSGGGGGGGGVGAAAAVAVAFGGVGEALPAVCKVLRSVKLQMQDAAEAAFEPPATRTIRVLADIGLAVAKAIVQRELVAAAATSRAGRQQRVGGGGGGGGIPSGGKAASRDPAATAAATVAELARRDHPARGVVPVRLLKLVDTAETRVLRADGSCLPAGYQVVLSHAVAEMGRRTTTTAQLSPRGGSAGAGRADGGRRPTGAPADGGDGGGSDGGEAGTQEGSEEGPVEEQGARKGAAGGRRSRSGAAVTKPKTVAVAACGGRDGDGLGSAAKRASGGGRGRGGRAGNTPRGGRSGAGRKRRRRSGGYESLSEGEPSSSSEEEEEEEEEEGLVCGTRSGPECVPQCAVAAAGNENGKGRGAAAAAAVAGEAEAAGRKLMSASTPLRQRAGGAEPRRVVVSEVKADDAYELPEDEEEERKEKVIEAKGKSGKGRAARPVATAGAGGGGSGKLQQRQKQQQGKQTQQRQQQQPKRGQSKWTPPLQQQPQQQPQQHTNGASVDGKEGVDTVRGDAGEEDDKVDKENAAGNRARGRGGGGSSTSASPGAVKVAPPGRKRTREVDDD